MVLTIMSADLTTDRVAYTNHRSRLVNWESDQS